MRHRLLYYCLITHLIFRDLFVFLVYFHHFLNLHLSLTHQTCIGVLERDQAYLLHFLVPPVLLIPPFFFLCFYSLVLGSLGKAVIIVERMREVAWRDYCLVGVRTIDWHRNMWCEKEVVYRI